jgi:hypothetical protein
MTKVVVESSTILRFARVERGVREAESEEGEFASSERLERFPRTAMLRIYPAWWLLQLMRDVEKEESTNDGSSFHLRALSI